MKIEHLRLFAMMAVMAAVMQLSCTVIDKSGEQTGGKSGVVTFYSPASPGIWESQAADHDPEIVITRIDDRKTINVTIPFAQQKDPRHYVEAIVVLDLQRKELKKMSFDRKRQGKGAAFDFPADFNEPVYVIMKCNKHGMWEKLVDWSE